MEILYKNYYPTSINKKFSPWYFLFYFIRQNSRKVNMRWEISVNNDWAEILLQPKANYSLEWIIDK